MLVTSFAAALLLQVGPPLVDHHQHFFSPEFAQLVGITPIDADKVIALLDSAGIRRALVLSVAYSWGNPSRNVENEYEHVKQENDWTAQQVARFPDRLRAFCSVNPRVTTRWPSWTAAPPIRSSAPASSCTSGTRRWITTVPRISRSCGMCFMRRTRSTWRL